LLAIHETYIKLVQEHIIEFFAFFHIYLHPLISDIMVFWMAIGGMVFRTVTTISRKGCTYLSTETGYTIWLEEIVNNLSIKSKLISLNKTRELQKRATIVRSVEDYEKPLEPGKKKGIFIAEHAVIHSFFKKRLEHIFEFMRSLIFIFIFWPISLFAMFRSPKLCYEFSGATVLFGRNFKHGKKAERFELIADLRRIFFFRYWHSCFSSV
jgi:hypothetical protein